MSETRIPVLKEIDPDVIERVAGGTCSPDDFKQFISDLKENYDTLVDFTSYVIERVAG